MFTFMFYNYILMAKAEEESKSILSSYYTQNILGQIPGIITTTTFQLL